MSETLTQTLARNPVAAAALAQGDALPLLDVSGSGLSKDAAITFLELLKAMNGYHADTNNSGTTTVSPNPTAAIHTEVITFGGSGSTTRLVVLSTANAPFAGARCTVRCALPATADITVEFRNATSGGTLLTSMVTDGSGDDCVAEFYHDGAAWNFLRFNLPANA
jgi:hypothetical protein